MSTFLIAALLIKTYDGLADAHSRKLISTVIFFNAMTADDKPRVIFF